MKQDILDIMLMSMSNCEVLSGEKLFQKSAVQPAIRAMRRTLPEGAMRTIAVHFPRGALALDRDGGLTRQPSLCGISTTGTVETWQTCLALARQWGAREPI